MASHLVPLWIKQIDIAINSIWDLLSSHCHVGFPVQVHKKKKKIFFYGGELHCHIHYGPQSRWHPTRHKIFIWFLVMGCRNFRVDPVHIAFFLQDLPGDIKRGRLFTSSIDEEENVTCNLSLFIWTLYT